MVEGQEPSPDGDVDWGWWIWVWVDDDWQLFKFTTTKKERRVKERIKALKRDYGLRFKYSQGWKEREKTNETETETRKEERVHAICGTDCDDPCTKTIEDEGRDWRNFQGRSRPTGPDFPDEAVPLSDGVKEVIKQRSKHYWHNGLCDEDCVLDPRPV